MVSRKIVLIGAGNLATRLGIELVAKGCEITQVYSRTAESASALATILNTVYTTNPAEIAERQELYIFSLKDDALPSVISATAYTGGLWVHTAGGVDMNIFKGKAERFGVFYPLQSFSKTRVFNFSEVSAFIEAASEADLAYLEHIGRLISGNVLPMDSEKRRYLHLAAVFSSNFVNHMYTIAFNLLEQQGIDGAALLPLMKETEAKAHTMHPFDGQTGPALRGDRKVMEKHLALLNDAEARQLYELISNHIQKTHHHE